MTAYIIEATRDNFAEAVLANSHKGPVMVNYWAENAGPCLRLWPVLEKLANDYQGQFLLVNIDTGKERQLAREYGVNSVPTVKLFVDGEVVEQIHGYDSADSFRKMLGKYLARASDAELAAAVELYRQGEVEAAFEALGKLVFIDPENDRILLTYAKLLIREQRWQQAWDLLENTALKTESDEAALLMTNAAFLQAAAQIESLEALQAALAENPDDCDRLFLLASHYMMHSDYAAALERLLRIIKLDFAWSNGKASLCTRGVFILLGKDHPVSVEYRQKLIDQQSA